REKLAAARAQLGNNPSGLASLAAEIEAAEAELHRLQRFLDLLDRAHQAEITSPEPRLVTHGRAVTEPFARSADEMRAAAAALHLEALGCYAVLEREDWVAALEGGFLGRDQVEQIRRAVYEELLWLATDLGQRRQDHRSGQKLSREASARAALVYLGRAETA